MNGIDDHNAANERKWSQRAASYDDKRHGYFRYMQRELIAFARITPPSYFLDLGCGTGWAVRYAANLSGARGRFTGVDISKGMIEKAWSNIGSLPNVEFYQASADDLPFDDASFNIVICSNSFHHYIHPEQALIEVRRILMPGGRIYILEVTADDFFIRWIDEGVRRHEREHVKFYSTAEYARMFMRARLRPLRSRLLKWFYPLKVHVAEKGG